MTLPKSFTTVTRFSKTLALVIFVLLPILAFYFGYKLGHLVSVVPTSILEIKKNCPPIETPTPTLISNNNSINLSEFKIFLPDSWKLEKNNPIDGAVILTQNQPFRIYLKLKIVKVKPSEVMIKNQLMGTTKDNARIYEETGIGGAVFTPYITVYPNGDEYEYQWDMDSTESFPQADDISIPNANFSQDDLLNIVKSSSKK